MTTRLVSFLGLRNPKKPLGYDPVEYSFEGRRAPLTPLVLRAISELLAPVDALVVLGTTEVNKQWIKSGAVRDELGRDPCFFEVPKGASESERWELFRGVRAALDLAPIPAAGEVEAPDRILFDMTHGFRTQPLFAMAVLSYMQSEWARSPAGILPELRVLYGAYDPANPPPAGEAAPIWDLTQQLTVTRWNQGLDALQRYGRADDLASLAAEAARALTQSARVQGQQGAALARHQTVKRFGEVARQFADDLALARFRDTLSREYVATNGKTRAGSAAALLAFLGSADALALADELPVLRDSFGRLADWVRPLIVGSLTSRDGILAMTNLAALYGRLQRFSEQVAAVREGTVLLYALGAGGAREPGTAGFHVAHLAADRELGAVGLASQKAARGDDSSAVGAAALAEQGRAPTELLLGAVRIFSAVQQPRNDVMHGGMNDDPRSAACLRSTLERHAIGFDQLARSTALAPVASPNSRKASVFLNLSNHTVTTWDDAQSQAARALGLGEPTDLPDGMPLIPSSASEDDVARLASELSSRAVVMGACGAHVAGEFTLTVALVAELKRRGVRCFAATTERVCSVGSEPGQAVRVFRFVRWREYR